jgi:hypothetical protein
MKNSPCQATNGQRLCAGGFERGLLLAMTFFEILIPPPTSQSSIFLLAKVLPPGGRALNAIANIAHRRARAHEKNPPGTGDFQTMKNSPCQATSMICNV